MHNHLYFRLMGLLGMVEATIPKSLIKPFDIMEIEMLPPFARITDLDQSSLVV